MHMVGTITLATLEGFPWWPYVMGPIGGILALIMAKVFSASVMKNDEGDDEMIRIAQAVREGAMAYLTRQYRVVALVFVVLVALLGGLYALGLQPALSMLGVPIAGFLSGLCGWLGMKMATNASARTAQAAKSSLNEALTVAFRAGAVMGMVVVGFALLDISIWYLVLNVVGDPDPRVLTTIMLSFGMGASTQALFARVGGGIYTKAADVGADLVGKIEAGIPEDDARNPATIADNVGDNVGDVAGMGADLYESYYGSILATMALGAAAAYTIPGIADGDKASLAIKLATAPIGLAGIGIICSIIGVFAVKAKEGASFSKLLKSLHMGVWTASALVIGGAILLLSTLLGGTAGEQMSSVTTWLGLFGSIAVGLASGLVIAVATEYYTSYEHKPTKAIAEQALTGPATVIIAGIAQGMKSTWAALLTVVVAILAAYSFAGGQENFLMGLYGVGIAAVGMLSTLGITLATDAYGPIADNAGGNAEMTDQPPEVRERTDMLDSLGNTTAATGKGFAIGSAALTALALFAAFIQIVQVQLTTQAEDYIEATAITAPADAEYYAVYQGYKKFAIVHQPQLDEAETERTDGALVMRLVSDDYKTKINDVAEVGTAYKVDRSDDGTSYTINFTKPQSDEVLATVTLASTRSGTLKDVLDFYNVSLANPSLLGGLFLGVLLAFLFCAMTMSAVGKAAYAMMNEARRQFAKMREAYRAQGMSEEQIADPMQWPKTVEFEGKTYPDYATCVTISTVGAQKAMVVPSLLAISMPIAVGLILGVPGVMGLLAGGLTSGFAVAVFMSNAGGAWDNAKKLLESYGPITADDMFDNPENANKVPETIRDAIKAKAEEMRTVGNGSGIVYGKGSDDHKATVVGDTVGDPFKDTSGPSLNILIKLISIVSIVFAGLTVKLGPVIGGILGIG